MAYGCARCDALWVVRLASSSITRPSAMAEQSPATLFEKIWKAHLVRRLDDGRDLIFVDRHVLQETTSAVAFDGLRRAGRAVRRPDLTIATQDHIVSTEPGRNEDTNLGGRELLGLMRGNAYRNRIRHFGVEDPRQGIVHVIAPELGVALPGCILACGDSHTSTVGGLGALGIGVGTSEVEHVLATQTLALARPRAMRIRFEGIASARDLGQGPDPTGDRNGRRRRRTRLRGGVRRPGDRGAVRRRPPHHLQHVDRVGRQARPDRAGREDHRVCARPGVRAARRRLRSGRSVLAPTRQRPRSVVRPRRNDRLRRHGPAGNMGNDARRRGRRRWPRARSRPDGRCQPSRGCREGDPLHGPGARDAAGGYPGRYRVHRLVHQRPPFGSRSRRGPCARPQGRARREGPCGAGLDVGEAGRRGARACITFFGMQASSGATRDAPCA